MLRSEARRALNVAPGASPAVVKDAYRRCLKQCHPDVGGSRTEFDRTVAAYQVLMTEPTARFVKSPSRWQTIIGRFRHPAIRPPARRVQ